MDRLSTLLALFGVRASLFHTGEVCGVATFDGGDQRGHMHLLQKGEVGLSGPQGAWAVLTRPSLIFLPRPKQH